MINTKEEFNKKYSLYLVEGRYGLSFNGEDFITVLDEVFETLVKIPNFHYTQIKLKFGELRFYTNLPFHLGNALQIYLNNKYKEFQKNNE